MRPSSPPIERSPLGRQTPSRAWTTPIHRTLFDSHIEATEGGVTPIGSPSFRRQFSNAGTSFRSQLEPAETGITTAETTFTSRLAQDGSSFRSQLEATETGIAPVERTSRRGTPYSERGATLRSHLEAAETAVIPTYETSFRPQVRISETGTSFRSELEPSEGGITPFDRTYRTQIQVPEPGRTVRSELEATRGGITPFDRSYRTQIQIPEPGQTVRSELEATRGGITPFDRTFRTQIQIPEPGQTVRSELEATRGGITPFDRPFRTQIQIPEPGQTVRSELEATRGGITPFDRTYRTQIQISEAGRTVRSELEATEGGVTPVQRTPFRPHIKLSGMGTTYRSHLEPSEGGIAPSERTPFRPRSGPPGTGICSDRRYQRSRSQPSRARASPAVGTPEEYSQQKSRRTQSPCVCPSNRRQTYIRSYPTVGRRRVRHTPQQKSVAGNIDDYQQFLQADLPQGVEELLDTTTEFEEIENTIQFEENERLIGEVSDAFQQLGGQIDAGSPACQVCRPCTPSGSSSAQVSDSGRPTSASIVRRRKSKEVVRHRKSREKISRPAKSQMPSNRRMRQGVTSSSARFPKPIASSTPLKTSDGSQAPGRPRSMSPTVGRSPRQRGAGACGVCPPALQQSESRQGPSHQLDDMQVPQTGSVSQRQRRNVPFTSDLSPERPRYPVPQTRVRHTDIISGITSDMRDPEEPPPPFHGEEPPGSLNRTGEEPEDIQPEVAAAMMYTEERGLRLGDAPQQMFSYLFRGDPSAQSSVNLMPVQSGVDESLVVPMKLQPQFSSTLNLSEVQSGIQQQPSTSLYSETVGPARQEQELSSILAGPSAADQQAVGGVDYVLKPKRPTHSSYVQLRGSQPPSWFPGYFEAVPTTNEGLRISNSPSNVMQNAWQYTHPSWYDPNTMVFTDMPEPSEIADIPEIQVNS